MGALLQAIFARGFLVYVFGLITIFSSVETMFKKSVGNGIAALVASTLAFFAVATFVGSYRARREKKYRVLDLFMIGMIAALFIFGAFALAYWSEFEISVPGLGTMDGFNWLIIAMILAPFLTRKEDAL